LCACSFAQPAPAKSKVTPAKATAPKNTPPASLESRLNALIDRAPSRSSFGIHVVDLKTGKAIYAKNENRMFLPPSNMKLAATALALMRLGADYRFTTKLVRESSGDLVLVGGGDPSLSGRTYPYGKNAPIGNPLRSIEDLADQAVAAGVKRVDGDIVG